MFSIESFKNCSKWCFDAFETKERALLADQIIENLKSKYECLGVGRHRIVFKLKSSNYVIKFPLGCSGEADNDWEGSLVTNKNSFMSDTNRVRTPKTKWINYKGFVCVIMEYLDENVTEKPEWAGKVDDGQIGTNKKGQILAFDFGVR